VREVKSMIDSFTTEQKARFSEFKEKWSRIGLSTAPADRLKAEKGISMIYETLGLKPPQVVWCTSPLANGLTRALAQRLSAAKGRKSEIKVWEHARSSISGGVGEGVWESVRGSVKYSTRSAIGNFVDNILTAVFDTGLTKDGKWFTVTHSVWGGFGDRIENCVGGVREAIRDSIYPSIRISLWDKFRDNARAESRDSELTGKTIWVEGQSGDFRREWERVRVKWTNGQSEKDSIGASIEASLRFSRHGQHDAAELAVCDYFRSVCGLVRETDKVIGYFEQAQAANWYLPHENICWVSERHNILRLNNRNRLHCETGPALEYPDGWSIYALNGVVVKPEYALTPGDQLDPGTILKEKNVDVRRELLRKVGIIRMVGYGKEIDRRDNYRLIDMSRIFKGSRLRYAPYLLMQSPSIDGAPQLKGVSPECHTVEQAINWRAGRIREHNYFSQMQRPLED